MPRRPAACSIDEMLAREPLLRLAAGSLGRSLLDTYLERRAIAPTSTIDVPNVSLLLAYAAAGVGVGLAPALPRLEAGSEQVATLRAQVPSLPVKLALRANYRLSLPMAAFLERVKDQGAAIARDLATSDQARPQRRPRTARGRAFSGARRPR